MFLKVPNNQWLDKESGVQQNIHIYIYFSYNEYNYVIWRQMDGTGDHYVKQEKPRLERQILHIFDHMQNLDLKIIIWLDCKGGTIWWCCGD
jgi:hypothetical protein